MKRTLGGLLVFVTMITVLLGMLQVLNWIPAAVQEGAFRKYPSIDEVRAHLKIDPVYTPVYYPRSVQWPPALVAAQTSPYTAVLTEFMKSDDRNETVLIITQTARSHPPLALRIRLTEVRETVQYPFKGRVAVLEVGVCRKEEQCSRMTWDEGTFRLSLVMRSSPVELVRIAESMVAQQPGR
ncbi:MAG: hypothetical protein AABZ15_15975 [Nitrospirota bacterium]